MKENQAAEELRQAAANGNILLLLNRQGKSQFVGLSAEVTGSTMPPADHPEQERQPLGGRMDPRWLARREVPRAD
jgi:hypothetical protein